MMSVKHFAVLCVFLGLAAQQASAFQIGLGKCPTDKAVVDPVDVARYMGMWYEIERFSQVWELGGRCSTANYTLDAETGRVNVKNSMRVPLIGEVSQAGYAELTNSSSTEAKLTVVFDVPIFGERKASYWVLDTDYDNYALVYSCSNLVSAIRLESAWILGRTTTLSDETKAKVEEAIKAANIKRSEFKATKQNC